MGSIFQSIIGPIAGLFVSMFSNYKSKAADQAILNTQQQNLKLQLMSDSTKYNSQLAIENLTGSPVGSIIKSFIVLVLIAPFFVVLIDPGYVAYVFTIEQQTIPAAYMQWVFSIVSVLYGVGQLQKLVTK